MLELFCARRIVFALCVVFLLGCLGEEGVVEFYDVTLGAVVCVQREDVHHVLSTREFLVDGIQEAPVTGTPAVDALLDIANNEILGIDMTHTLLQQYLEVLPLDGRRVLELVDHDVLQARTDFLEDER